MESSFKHFRLVLRIKSSQHFCSGDIWLFSRSLENLQWWCWFTTTQWGHLKSTAQSCQQTKMRTLQQYANGICRAGNEQPRRPAPIPVSRDGRPGSGGWHPENLVLTNFFLLLIIFLVIIVLFSWRLAEAVVFLKAGGDGNLRFASFWLIGRELQHKINIKLIIRLRYSGSS